MGFRLVYQAVGGGEKTKEEQDNMSTRYIDIKQGMDVDFWIKPMGKKRNTEIDADDPATGTGRVIYSGPHFVTIQTKTGRKVTISRNDIIDKHAQLRPAKKVSRAASRFADTAVT